MNTIWAIIKKLNKKKERKRGPVVVAAFWWRRKAWLRWWGSSVCCSAGNKIPKKLPLVIEIYDEIKKTDRFWVNRWGPSAFPCLRPCLMRSQFGLMIQSVPLSKKYDWSIFTQGICKRYQSGKVSVFFCRSWNIQLIEVRVIINIFSVLLVLRRYKKTTVCL